MLAEAPAPAKDEGPAAGAAPRPRRGAPSERAAASEPAQAAAPSPGSTPTLRTGPTLGERARAILLTVLRALRTAGERLLPDRPPPSPDRPRRKRRAAKRRTIKRPNLAVGIALAIPITALLVVGAYRTYQDWSTRSQFAKTLDAAKQTQELALRNTGTPRVARDYWNQTIEHALAADQIQPGLPEIQQLVQQAYTAIDQIDQVTRLAPPHKIYDYAAPNSAPSRVIASGVDVYVLDLGVNQVHYHVLNQTYSGLRDQESSRVLVQQAQPIDGQTVGPLVDITWLPKGGDRQSGSLLVIDRNALVVEFDPAWGENETMTLGGNDVWRMPVAAKTFDGNLYLLDSVANQIFRYSDGQYENAPTRWLQGEVDASTAIDLGIDGSIYVIHSDGTIEKFFGGESTPFEVTGVPQPLNAASAFYLDIEETAKHIYVADAAEIRILQLARDGSFVRQFRLPAEQERLFSGLSGVFVDEPAGKLFFLAANALYVVDLPPVPV